MKGDTSMLNNNRIGFMHFWCQKVLPLVYDNSLSYYEALLKFKRKLNEVIEYTNQIPDYIDEKVTAAFDENHLRELISEVFRTIEDAISANNEGTNVYFHDDYELGDLLWHDNKFYEVIRHIDAGDAVLVNTNIKLVNFADMFNDFIYEVKSRFTENDDGLRETSSIDRPVHDLVWLKGELYEVVKPIAEGNAYIYTGANKNVERTNLDKIYDYILDLISSEIDAREEDIETVKGLIEDEAHAREDADTALSNKIGDLATLTTTNKSDAVAAINELNGNIGELENLTTIAKNNIVSAINEINSHLDDDTYVHFEEYGAIGDGVTDDTVAINTALASGRTEFKLLAGKTYLVSGNINIATSHTHITGEENACIKCANNSYTSMFSLITIDAGANLTDIELDNFTLDGNAMNNMDFGDPDSQGNLPKHYAGRVMALVNFTSVANVFIHNMKFVNAWNGGLYLSDCPYSEVTNNVFKDCRVHSIAIRNNTSVSAYPAYTLTITDNIIENSVVGIENIFGVFDVTISGNIISKCDDMNKFPSWAFNGTYPNVYPKDTRFNTPASPNYITPAQEGDGAGIESTGVYTDPNAPTTASITYANNIVNECEVGLRVEEVTNDVTITGNITYFNHKYGVFIFSARKVTVSSNVCNYNKKGVCIQNLIDIPTNIVINGNQISSNTEHGVLAEVDSIVISNNSFDNNPVSIAATTIMNHAIITGNVFTDYYGILNTGINMTNITENAIIDCNSFDVPTPVANLTLGQMKCFGKNFNLPTRFYGTVDVDSSLSANVEFPSPFAFVPWNGEIMLTPMTVGTTCGISNITTAGFTITTNQAATVAWCVDFSKY